MSYTIGVNRVGVDPNNYEYNGNSVAYDMLGNCIDKKNNNEEISIIIELDIESQLKVRNRFLFLEDQDNFIFQ